MEADPGSEKLYFSHRSEVMESVQHMHQLNNISSPTYNIPSMSGYLVIGTKVKTIGVRKRSASVLVIILMTNIVCGGHAVA
jgi:hypothetical protein